jgi:tetratricopeptide (TPR) repeat protein
MSTGVSSNLQLTPKPAQSEGREDLIAWAVAAQEQRNWEEAWSRWAVVRKRFPDEWGGYGAAAAAARELGRLDEAEQLLYDAAAHFSGRAVWLHELARIAERKGNWAEAEALWRRFIAVDPKTWWGHANLAVTLREQGRVEDAEEVLRGAREALPDEPPLIAEHARLAEARQDWDASLERWIQMRERFPDEWAAYRGGANALHQLGRLGEMTSLLHEASARFPANDGVQIDLARSAEASKDWPQAEKSWRRFVELNSAQWWGHTSLASVLHTQGKLEEADAALEAAQAQLPSEPAVFLEYARLADARNDSWLRLLRWQTVLERFPDQFPGHAGVAAALFNLGQPEGARDILAAAAQRFPDEAAPLFELARMAEWNQDWAAASDYWRRSIAIEPQTWWAHTGLATALYELGHGDDAEEVLARARQMFSAEAEVLRAHAHLAYRREQWAEAYRRFVELYEADPDLAWEAMGDLRQRLADLKDIVDLAADRWPIEASEDDEAMFTKFEPLGANCEFGMVQRRFGVEPLGLLRWADIRPDPLIMALNTRFAGVGDPDRTNIRRWHSPFRHEDEWNVIAHPYFSMHTHIPVDELRKEEEFERIRRRLVYLRDELIADLEDGEKIFLYKERGFRITSEQIFEIYEALRTYNPHNRLFVVHLANDEHAPGEVYNLADGLLAGCLEVDAMAAERQFIPFETWHKVVSKAFTIFK